MVTLMQRRREMMRLASVVPSINDYVQDGIFFWLDGIENTRNGHNAQSAKWEDISTDTNPFDYTYRSDSVIGSNYCIPNGLMAGAGRISSTTESYTIEVVLEWIDTQATQFIVPWKGNNYGTVWLLGSVDPPQLFFSAGKNNGCRGVNMPKTGINTFTGRGKASIAINGVPGTIVTNSSSWSATRSNFGDYGTDYPRPCRSKIYAFRIYNRLLTDAEVLHNRSIDVARFK